MIIPDSHNVRGFNTACMKFEGMIKGDRILREIESSNPNLRYVFSFLAAYRYIREFVLNPTSSVWFDDEYKSYITPLHREIKGNSMYRSVYSSVLNDCDCNSANIYVNKHPDFPYLYFMENKGSMYERVDSDDY